MDKKNKAIFKMHCLVICTVCISLLSHSAFAEIKTFVKEYTYQASDEDSRNSSRVIALREVKRLLLEELGTYLESQTEVINFQMTKDQITTLTAGIVSTEVIEDTWDGKKYWLKAKIAANPQDVIKSIDNLRKDREKVKELVALRKKSEELLRENERLNKELKVAKGGKKKEALQAYKRNIDNLSATEWYERGYELVLSGNNADAVKAFNMAIELDPRNAWAYYSTRGVAYDNLGNHQQAIKDFNKAIELKPQDAGAYTLRGIAYGGLGNYQQKIKDFNKAIELNPQDARTYCNRGLAYGLLGNYQQAIRDLNKAIELDPKDGFAYWGRGEVYANLGNHQQAIEDYNMCILLDPRAEKAYNDRGIAYAYIGNHQQAINDYTKALELDSRDEKAYSNRGLSYVHLGNYRQAIEDYDKAIELNPRYAEAYGNRAGAYALIGDGQQAEADVKAAARLGHVKAQDLLKSNRIEW
ncbi:MAG: tetratricopeptide repeat protein [Syntrophales bacterium]|nr:tetratricopeptide repeat protein [Syntrophales bacterium]